MHGNENSRFTIDAVDAGAQPILAAKVIDGVPSDDWSLVYLIIDRYQGRSSLERRLLHKDWRYYDTRHAIFKPHKMSVEQLEAGCWRAYKQFYSWQNIYRASATNDTMLQRIRQLAYAVGWKKFEPFWDWIIRTRRLSNAPYAYCVLVNCR